jgi:hypothetical protein
VNPALAGVALAVVLGAVVAASARDARTAIFGLVVALVAAPLVADPPVAPLALAARLVGAVLAGYLLWIAARGHNVRTAGSRLGWPADAFVAAGAAVVGYGSHGLGVPALGPAAASAAGLALIVTAIVPIATGRDILRVGLGLELLLAGALLVATGLGGTPDPLFEVLAAATVATLGGAVAVLAAHARTDGSGGFAMSSTTPHRPSHAGEPTRDGRR